MTTENLKPRPMLPCRCGKTPEWHCEYDERSGWGDATKGYLHCECGIELGAPKPWSPNCTLTKEQAIAAWNRRTDTAQELREALTELCDAVNCATSSGYTNYSRYVKDAHRAALAALARPELVADLVAHPDAVRLDWLEKGGVLGSYKPYNIREAIDAARSSEIGEGGLGAPVGAPRPPANHDASSTSSPQPTAAPAATEDARKPGGA